MKSKRCTYALKKVKYIFILLLVTATCYVYAQQTGKWGDQGNGTYRNPVIAGDYSDPDLVRVGEDYYMVCSTFESSPGVTVLHSKDLVNWETIGAVFSNLIVADSGFSCTKMKQYNKGVFAPTIHYHNGKFYVYVNLHDDGFFRGIAVNPAGPWQVQQLIDKNKKPLKLKGWTDPCPFWDDDGKAYLMISHPGTDYWYSYLFQMSVDGKMLLDADSAYMAKTGIIYAYPDGGTLISPYQSSEGNRIFKRNGYYYLMHIEFLDKGNGSGTYILRSRNIYGTKPDRTTGKPGEPSSYDIYRTDGQNGPGHQQILPGQGGFVTTPDGRWFYMAQFNRYGSDGRTPNLLPVTWVNDWPVIGVNPSGQSAAMSWDLGKPVQGYQIKLPEGSDDFSGKELRPIWQWNHQPRDDKWSLTERKGWLRLHAFKTAGSGGFFKAGNTINQRHLRSDSTVETVKMDISGMTSGQKAGLVHFNGGKQYAFLGIEKNKEHSQLIFEENGQKTKGPILITSSSLFYLRSSTKFDDTAHFFYSADGTHFSPFGKSYKIISGNYRGEMIGIFNYNDKNDKGFIDVDWFSYKIYNK
jgi:beta-xylosidase